MGYYNDLGTSTVEDTDPITGYPRDKYGHLLDPEGVSDIKRGTELHNLTSPYGFLEFAIGSGDDFLCMDYATITTKDGLNFIILHTTLNSETGSFIQGSGYEVLPIDTQEQKREALSAAIGMMDGGFEDVRHSEKGWNQDVWYWARCIDRALNPDLYKAIPRLTERQMRHGGKRVNSVFFRKDRCW